MSYNMGEIRGWTERVEARDGRFSLVLATQQYGDVDAVLPFVLRNVLREEGGEHVAISGALIFCDGRLLFISGDSVRLVHDAPAVDLDSIRDANFTGGLDPVAYLDALHSGEL